MPTEPISAPQPTNKSLGSRLGSFLKTAGRVAKTLAEPALYVATGAALVVSGIAPIGFAFAAYGTMKAGWRIAKTFDPAPDEPGLLWRWLDDWFENREKEKEQQHIPTPFPEPTEPKRAPVESREPPKAPAAAQTQNRTVNTNQKKAPLPAQTSKETASGNAARKLAKDLILPAAAFIGGAILWPITAPLALLVGGAGALWAGAKIAATLLPNPPDTAKTASERQEKGHFPKTTASPKPTPSKTTPTASRTVKNSTQTGAPKKRGQLFNAAGFVLGFGLMGYGIDKTARGVFSRVDAGELIPGPGEILSGNSPPPSPPPPPISPETTGVLDNTGTLTDALSEAGPNPFDPDAPYYNPLPNDIPINRGEGVSDAFYDAIVQALTKVPPGLRDMLFKHVEINVGRTMLDIHPEESEKFDFPDSQGRVNLRQQSGAFRVNSDGKIEINIAEWHYAKGVDLSNVDPIAFKPEDQLAEHARYYAEVEQAARDQGMFSEVSTENGWLQDTPETGAGALLHEIGHFEYALEGLSKDGELLSGFDADVSDIGSVAEAEERGIEYYYTNNGDSTNKGTEAVAECTEEFLKDGLSSRTTTMEENFPETYSSTVEAIKETTATLDTSKFSTHGSPSMSYAEASSPTVSTTPFDNFLHSADTHLGAVSETLGAGLSHMEHSIVSHIDLSPSLSGLKVGLCVGLMYMQYYDPEQFVGTTRHYVGHKILRGAKKAARAAQKINRSSTKYALLDKLHKLYKNPKKKKQPLTLAKTPRGIKTPKPAGM